MNTKIREEEERDYFSAYFRYCGFQRRDNPQNRETVIYLVFKSPSRIISLKKVVKFDLDLRTSPCRLGFLIFSLHRGLLMRERQLVFLAHNRSPLRRVLFE